MSTLSVTLPDEDVARLADLAERQGATPEAIAAAAVKARLDEEAAWSAEVEAGLRELDAGAGVSLEDFEREMDAFVAELRSKRG